MLFVNLFTLFFLLSNFTGTVRHIVLPDFNNNFLKRKNANGTEKTISASVGSQTIVLKTLLLSDAHATSQTNK